MQRTTSRRARWRSPVRRSALPTLLILSAVLVVSACGLSDDLRATVGLPTAERTPADDDVEAADVPAAGHQHRMTVTVQQRDYLDALAEAGITPSSDLLALSIGSSVCQARAAHQSDQAVWDFVAPLVRSDVRSAQPDGAADSDDGPAAALDTVTADYIRIATEQLC